MCLQEQPNFRPLIGDIVVALEYLFSQSKSQESRKCGVNSTASQSPSELEKYFPEETNPRMSPTSA